jgi:hypothetical protein
MTDFGLDLDTFATFPSKQVSGEAPLPQRLDVAASQRPPRDPALRQRAGVARGALPGVDGPRDRTDAVLFATAEDGSVWECEPKFSLPKVWLSSFLQSLEKSVSRRGMPIVVAIVLRGAIYGCEGLGPRRTSQRQLSEF